MAIAHRRTRHRITDAATRARYEAAVLDRAATITPGRLRRIAQLAAELLLTGEPSGCPDAPHAAGVGIHPVTEMVLAVDNYRPSEQLRQYLRHRDRRCRFPSCNRQPHRCDIDHTIDAQHGGRTNAGNLACLCRNHHVLKHQTPWRVRQTEPGVLEWTSPLGRVTEDSPDRLVRFS